MPNWTQNSVRFVSEKTEQLQKLKKMLESNSNQKEKNVFDFNKIVPMPKNIFQGNLGEEEGEKYGKNHWYDWSIKHWGTKWNSCNARIVEDSKEVVEYHFLSAWDCPRVIAYKIEDFLPSGVTCHFWECVHEDGQEEETIIRHTAQKK
jgi:hypothetical protein